MKKIISFNLILVEVFWVNLCSDQGFFFSPGISEISPETGILATLREIHIPFKKIWLNLNFVSRISTNKLRMINITDAVVCSGGWVLGHCPTGTGVDSTLTHIYFWKIF
jgi:hypothetical protein